MYIHEQSVVVTNRAGWSSNSGGDVAKHTRDEHVHVCHSHSDAIICDACTGLRRFGHD